MNAFLLLVLLVGVAAGTPRRRTRETTSKCGYESCTQAEPDQLNVHIVPHTHDDVGWLKTVDQYYYGSRNDIQKAGVQYILDSVVKELLVDEKRRFIYVETAFFWKWWVRQTAQVQEDVKKLVNEGRLQFVGGAWSMNDEAASHYHSVLDQFTHGLEKLNSTFGRCGVPTVGWQIDPFGHSREFASLLSNMGYDGLFLGRIDYQDKMNRLQDKSMEVLWRGDDDLGKSSDIFTGVLYNTYQPPPGFCFDVLCDDEPIIDDPDSPDFNVEQRVSKFLKFVNNQAKYFKSNNVILTMGGDFTYQDAGMWYTNLDKLIEYANLKAAKDNMNLKLFYSTPTCYLKAIKDANPTLPIKQDDYFPYASDPTAFWTGYFTSRPTTKYFERRGNVYLQMAKQLQVLLNLEEHNMFVINELKAAMGVMQHHDAITGTEKQHVTHDYVRLLDTAIEDSIIVANQAYNKYLYNDTRPPTFEYKRCALNESSCPISEDSEKFVVTLYNPLPWKVDYMVSLPVKEKALYEVWAPNGESIVTDVQEIYKGFSRNPQRKSHAKYELKFEAYLKPLNFKSFYVIKKNRVKRDNRNIDKDEVVRYLYENINKYWNNNNFDMKNIEELKLNEMDEKNNKYNKYDDVVVVIPDKTDQARDRLTGEVIGASELSDAFKVMIMEANMKYEMEEAESRMLGDEPRVVEQFTTEKLKQFISHQHALQQSRQNGLILLSEVKYYPSCAGNNRNIHNRSSGAYIFRPNSTKPISLDVKHQETVENAFGKEFRTIYDHNVTIVVKYYNKLPFVEVEWMVGPISVDDDIGKEFILQHKININNNGVFYTDSNGRQMIKRIKDKRPQFNVTLREPIPGNYYPVTNKISLRDDSVEMIVVTDRSEGGTSLNDGVIELMVHRRMLSDDAFGVGEALNETLDGEGLVVKGKHTVIITPSVRDLEAALKVRKLELGVQYEPIVLLADASKITKDDWLKLGICYHGLKSIPDGVNILTLEPWHDGTILLRLENILSKDDVKNKDEDLSRKIDLTKLFNNLNIYAVKETNLAANKWLEEVEKWNWETEREFDDSFNDAYGTDVKSSTNRVGVNKDEGLIINLEAKQIRTFVVNYNYVGHEKDV